MQGHEYYLFPGEPSPPRSELLKHSVDAQSMTSEHGPLETIFLRPKKGDLVGPLSTWALEILWDAQIIDETTPVSKDGIVFTPIIDHPPLVQHLRDIIIRLDRGEDLWPATIPVLASKTSASLHGHKITSPILRLLIRHARKRSSGILELNRDQGLVKILYRDGKIVTLEVEDQSLSFAQWLIDQGLVTPQKVTEVLAIAATPSKDDIGRAFVSSGALSPNVYYEKVVAWSLATLGHCSLLEFDKTHFRDEPIAPPTISLGFDRLGVFLSAIRETASKDSFISLFNRLMNRPLVPTPVEGFSIEDAKPRPRERRVFKTIDGIFTLSELLHQLGGDDERDRDVLRTVFFSIEAGLVTFAPNEKADLDTAEIKQLEAIWLQLKSQDPFTLFGLSPSSSDKETRDKYNALSAQFHPDSLRPSTSMPLRNLRRRIFNHISVSYQYVDTIDKRDLYRLSSEGSFDEKTRPHTIDIDFLTPIKEHLEKIDKSIDNQKFGLALEQTHKALIIDPKHPELELCRLFLECLPLHQERLEHEEAIKSITQVIHQHGASVRGYLYLGRLYHHTKALAYSIKCYEKVLTLTPENQSAQIELQTVQKEYTS